MRRALRFGVTQTSDLDSTLSTIGPGAYYHILRQSFVKLASATPEPFYTSLSLLESLVKA
jgi:hypothetical protein